jgi:hypothetical protein
MEQKKEANDSSGRTQTNAEHRESLAPPGQWALCEAEIGRQFGERSFGASGVAARQSLDSVCCDSFAPTIKRMNRVSQEILGW